MKIAIYIRVSTKDKQDISKQRSFLLDFASRNNYQVVDVYQDVGISGSKSSRPSLDRMLQDKDLWDACLVYKIDRIGRSMRNLFELMDWFKSNNKEFMSATQSIDTSKPEGRLFFNMLSAFAEFEREMIVSRINDGLVEAVKKGSKLGRPKGSKDSIKRRKIGYLTRWENEKTKR